MATGGQHSRGSRGAFRSDCNIFDDYENGSPAEKNGCAKNGSSVSFTQAAVQYDQKKQVETIEVPDFTIGFLNGSEGTGIQQLMAASQTEISISRQSEIPVTDGHFIISIKGLHKAVHHAKKWLYHKIDEYFRLEAMFTNSNTAQDSRHIDDVNLQPSVASRIQPWWSGDLADCKNRYEDSIQKVEEKEIEFPDCNRRMRCFRPAKERPEYFKDDTNTSNKAIQPWRSGNSSAPSPSVMRYSEETPSRIICANFAQAGKSNNSSNYDRETSYFKPAAGGYKHFLNFSSYRSTLVETTYIYMSIRDNGDFDCRMQWICQILGAFAKVRDVMTTVGKGRRSMILKEVMIKGSALIQCQSQSLMYRLNPRIIWIEFDVPSIFMPHLIGVKRVKLTKYATLSSATFSIPGIQDRIRVPGLDKKTLRVSGGFLSVQRAQRLVRDYLHDLYETWDFRNAASNCPGVSTVDRNNDHSDADDYGRSKGSASDHGRYIVGNHAKNQDSNEDRSKIKDCSKGHEVKDAKEHVNAKRSTNDAKASALPAANDAVVDNIPAIHDDISASLLATCDDKLAGKRDPQLEAEVLQWIQEIMGEKLPSGPYDEIFRDGTILCRFMNKLMPGCIQKINTSGGQFKMMANINRFQEAAKKWGVPEIDVFQTVDLWERRNIAQVTQCMMTLGRACYTHPEYSGPCLGPKPSEENKREFTEEQLRAGEGIINLQYGTNKGANMSGQMIGNTRHM